jgi:cytochrome c-type biogenesis protein CcmH/NrfF
MDNTVVIWGLVIAFLVLAFVGVYLYRLRVVADDYTKLKNLSNKSIKDRTDLFLDKMNSKQLDTLLKVHYKKHKSK